MTIDTFTRFASKSKNYAKSRPDYAPEAIRAIIEHTKLIPASVVADIGSGTGIVSRHFVENGNSVYAVEPNPEMRRMAEIELGKRPNFHSVNGNSEGTTLPEANVDLITVGQAIGWFDPEPSKQEFLRILKPNGWFSVVQYSRCSDDLTQAISQVCSAENGWQRSSAPKGYPYEWWFGENGQFLYLQFPSPRTFDLENLIGLELSNSHAPDESHPAQPAFVDALHSVFESFQDGGTITINFMTHLYLGLIN
jgi:SAM-dependent methyltransferase